MNAPVKRLVFISHSHLDEAVSRRICTVLEREGISCFISSRPGDLTPGASFPTAIVDALNDSVAMVVVFTRNTNGSSWVERELLTAFNRKLPIYLIRIENVEPKGGFELMLSAVQWTNAFPGRVEDHLSHIIARLRPMFPAPKPKAAKSVEAKVTPLTKETEEAILASLDGEMTSILGRRTDTAAAMSVPAASRTGGESLAWLTPGTPAADPLAELARLIGKSDPFTELTGRSASKSSDRPAPEWLARPVSTHDDAGAIASAEIEETAPTKFVVDEPAAEPVNNTREAANTSYEVAEYNVWKDRVLPEAMSRVLGVLLFPILHPFWFVAATFAILLVWVLVELILKRAA